MVKRLEKRWKALQKCLAVILTVSILMIGIPVGVYAEDTLYDKDALNALIDCADNISQYITGGNDKGMYTAVAKEVLATNISVAEIVALDDILTKGINSHKYLPIDIL